MEGSELKTISFQQIRRHARCRSSLDPSVPPQLADESILPVPDAQSPDGQPEIPQGPLPPPFFFSPPALFPEADWPAHAAQNNPRGKLSCHRLRSNFLLGAQQNSPSTHPMYVPLDAPNRRHLISSTNLRLKPKQRRIHRPHFSRKTPRPPQPFKPSRPIPALVDEKK
jgi:hypothetical protein